MKSIYIAASTFVLTAGLTAAAYAQTTTMSPGAAGTTSQPAPYASGQPAPAGTPVGPTGSLNSDANFGMHARDQHLFVIGTVENADPPALRQISGRAPEEIVQEFGSAWMLEAEHLTALRVNAGHHVPDGAILSRRIHRLEISSTAYWPDA